MRSTILALVLVGCGSSHSTHAAVDGPGDPVVCKAALEAAIDRTCSVPADCALVMSADCCGTVDLAVKLGTESSFPAVESTFVSCLACPPLGCAHQDMAEDGGTPGSGHSIVPTCELGRCKAIVQ